MENFLQEKKESRGINKVLVGALLIAAALVAGGLWLLTFVPSSDIEKLVLLGLEWLVGTVCVLEEGFLRHCRDVQSAPAETSQPGLAL